MSDSSDSPGDSDDSATGPAGLALPLALATAMAARTAPARRPHEISATSDPTGHKRRAARRRATAVRG
ncbi:hypothetical protein F0344_15915 [Streptomyces finlayi]|uniref:Uncharacterized protein n=1 Tax=Streptomyces finlayi TaxID=67296 RepID=A0A7G7BKR1_9ACTN|nr:hypothetical protein [Streptomyces finlayi]QNE75926.1 hypothetical protein F0344_15915 [Streptomyces finlayi]